MTGRIAEMVRDQIADAIEHDLQGGESLMKEVFEQIDGEAEKAECYAEMRLIIEWLRGQK